MSADRTDSGDSKPAHGDHETPKWDAKPERWAKEREEELGRNHGEDPSGNVSKRGAARDKAAEKVNADVSGRTLEKGKKVKDKAETARRCPHCYAHSRWLPDETGPTTKRLCHGCGRVFDGPHAPVNTEAEP